ncbi:MAG: HEAT repeat domain-containing protein [Desulfobulbaceae bacterium]|jgi:HEAT repeat protein
MRRIIIFLIPFLLLYETGLARFEPPGMALPGLDKISAVVAHGSDEEKIRSLADMGWLTGINYWKRQENWLPLVKLLADESPVVRAESVRFCGYLVRKGVKRGASEYLQTDDRPLGYELLAPYLYLALQDSDPDVRKEACKTVKEAADPDAVPLLDPLLDDPDPWVQLEAIRALSQIEHGDSPTIVNHLLELLGRSEPWPYVLMQREALHLLQGFKLPPESGPLFFSTMQNRLSDPYLTRGVISLLFSNFSSLTPEARGYILALLQVRDKNIPLQVLQKLRDRPPPPSWFVQTSRSPKSISCNYDAFSELKDEKGNDFDLTRRIEPLLSSDYPEIRQAAAGVLGRITTGKATDLLHMMAHDSDPGVRAAAVRGELFAEDPGADAVLSSRLHDPDDNVRQAAISVAASRLRQKGSGKLQTFLLGQLHDPYPPIRLDAAGQLLQLETPELLEEIIPLLSDREMGEVFDQLIRGKGDKKVYIYRGEVGRRIVTSDKKSAEPHGNFTVKLIHNKAAEGLLQYLATCKGDCSAWQDKLVKLEHEQVETYLLGLAVSGSSEERLFALRWLGGYATERSFPTITSLLHETDISVVQNLYRVIRTFHCPEFASIVIEQMQNPNALIRSYAAWAAGAYALHSAAMIDALIPLLQDPDEQVRSSSLISLFQLNYTDFTATALPMLHDSSKDVQRAALYGLQSKPPTSESLDILFGLIDEYETEDGYHLNAELAINVIGKIGDSAAVEPLFHLIEKSRTKKSTFPFYANIAGAARNALTMIDSPAAEAILVRFLDSEENCRIAMEVLAKLASPNAVAPLVRLLDTPARPHEANAAYWLLRENFSRAGVKKALASEPDGEKLWLVFARQFPEKEAFLWRLDKLIDQWREDAAEPGAKKEQWPAIYSSIILKERIRQGTLRMNEGQDLFSLILDLLHDEDKQVIRHAAEDLAQMKDPGSIDPIKEAILIECNGRIISPIIEHLLRALHTIGGRDMIPFMVEIMECPAPLSELRAKAVLDQNYTTDEIYQALVQDKDHEQLLKTLSRHNPLFRTFLTGKGVVSAAPATKPPAVPGAAETVSFPPQPVALSAGYDHGRMGTRGGLIEAHGKSTSSGSGPVTDRKGLNSFASCEDRSQKYIVSDPEQIDNRIISLEKISELKEMLRTGTVAMWREAADQLGNSYDLSVAQALVPLLHDKDPYVRQAAVRALGKLRADSAVQEIITLLGDTDQYVQEWAAYALQRMNDPSARKAYSRYLDQAAGDSLQRVYKLAADYP